MEPTPKPITKVEGLLRPCCGDERNLTAPGPVTGRPGYTARRCRVCARLHYTMHAEPGRLGLRAR
jgi:hypothetical protein